jgi:hypothetical protein
MTHSISSGIEKRTHGVDTQDAPCIDVVTTTTSLVHEKKCFLVFTLSDQDARFFIAMDYSFFF